MHSFRGSPNKGNNKLNLIFGSIAFGLLVAATYLTFSQHPIANSISRWQSKLINDKNNYYPALTICLLALPPLIILLLVKIVLLRRNEKNEVRNQ